MSSLDELRTAVGALLEKQAAGWWCTSCKCPAFKCKCAKEPEKQAKLFSTDAAPALKRSAVSKDVRSRGRLVKRPHKDPEDEANFWMSVAEKNGAVSRSRLIGQLIAKKREQQQVQASQAAPQDMLMIDKNAALYDAINGRLEKAAIRNVIWPYWAGDERTPEEKAEDEKAEAKANEEKEREEIAKDPEGRHERLMADFTKKREALEKQRREASSGMSADQSALGRAQQRQAEMLQRQRAHEQPLVEAGKRFREAKQRVAADPTPENQKAYQQLREELNKQIESVRYGRPRHEHTEGEALGVHYGLTPKQETQTPMQIESGMRARQLKPEPDAETKKLQQQINATRKPLGWSPMSDKAVQAEQTPLNAPLNARTETGSPTDRLQFNAPKGSEGEKALAEPEWKSKGREAAERGQAISRAQRNPAPSTIQTRPYALGQQLAQEQPTPADYASYRTGGMANRLAAAKLSGIKPRITPVPGGRWERHDYGNGVVQTVPSDGPPVYSQPSYAQQAPATAPVAQKPANRPVTWDIDSQANGLGAYRNRLGNNPAYRAYKQQYIDPIARGETVGAWGMPTAAYQYNDLSPNVQAQARTRDLNRSMQLGRESDRSLRMGDYDATQVMQQVRDQALARVGSSHQVAQGQAPTFRAPNGQSTPYSNMMARIAAPVPQSQVRQLGQRLSTQPTAAQTQVLKPLTRGPATAPPQPSTPAPRQLGQTLGGAQPMAPKAPPPALASAPAPKSPSVGVKGPSTSGTTSGSTAGNKLS